LHTAALLEDVGGIATAACWGDDNVKSSRLASFGRISSSKLFSKISLCKDGSYSYMSHIRGIQKGKAKILEQFILYVGVFCCIIRYRELEC